ncbi:MAG TPA: HIT family protein [Ignavibacteria bacterium]
MNNCQFCNIEKEKILFSNDEYWIIKDNFPVSPGHLLIISKEHRENYFDLTIKEKNELNDMLLKAKSIIDNEYKPDGYNIGINCGSSSGQTVMHFHCHLIPRYEGDTENPRGGVRHVIPGKGYY